MDNISNSELRGYIDGLSITAAKGDKYSQEAFEKEVADLDAEYSDENYSVRESQSAYIEKITADIKEYEELSKKLSEYIEEINKQYEELQEHPEKEREAIENSSLSEEKVGEIRDEFLGKRISNSEAIQELRKKIEETRAQLKTIGERIEQTRREFRFAAILKLTQKECHEVFASKIMEEIIDIVVSAKTSTDIASARTAINELLGKQPSHVITDNIQILYNTDDEAILVELSRAIKIPPEKIININTNITIKKETEAVKVTGASGTEEKEAKEMPDDMKYTNTPADAEMKTKKNTGDKPKQKTYNQLVSQYNKNSKTYDELCDFIIMLEQQLEKGSNNPLLQRQIAHWKKERDKKKQKLDELTQKLNEAYNRENIADSSLIDQINNKQNREESKNNEITPENEEKNEKENDESKEEKEANVENTSNESETPSDNASDTNVESETNALESNTQHVEIPAEAESAHEKEVAEEEKQEENTATEERGLRDKVTIFRDKDNDRVYVRKATFTRFFGDEKNLEEVRINGALCYAITNKEEKYLLDHQDNEMFPYFINDVEVHLGKAKTLTPTRVPENNNVLGNQSFPRLPAEAESAHANDGNGSDGNNGDDNNLGNEERPEPTGETGNDNTENGDGSTGNNDEGNKDNKLGNEERPVPTGKTGNSDGNADNNDEDDKDKNLGNESRPVPTGETGNGNTENGDSNTGNNDEDNNLGNETRPEPTGETGNGNTGDGNGSEPGNENNTNDDIPRIPAEAESAHEHDGDNQSNTNDDIPRLPAEAESAHEHDDDNEEEHENENDEERGLKDKVTIFRDLDNDKLYIRKAAFTRFFGDDTNVEEVRIDGALCYAITKDEEKYLLDNQDNEISPYFVVYKDVHLGKKKPGVEEETVVIFKAVDEDGQLYATKDVHDKFGLETEGDPIDIQGKQCYKVSPEKDKIIQDKAKKSENPKINVVYKPVYIKKKEEQPKVETHYQEVIRKLTSGLDIKKKDGKRYRASNIKVAKSFRDELRSGNYLYNILHTAPAIVKAGVNFFRKITSKLFLSKRGRDVTREINTRLNGESENKECNLTDEDLEVLWQHYKGRNLRADMNNQINPIIITKLREYGLKKVEALNNEIKQHYLAVIAATDEIEDLKAEIAKTTDPKKKEELQKKLKELYKFAAKSVKIIEDRRKEADDILSSGVHGIEEDFKAVETKMNYIGFRFSKQNDFDNELQDSLADAGKRINTARAYNDDEGLVNAFIDYEKIYYEETEVKNSLVGKRSTGKKWYQPVAEQMDYRDDPFIRDLFTTIAAVSAAVSIANGIITHLQKDQQFQQQVNNDINSTNAANRQYDASVQHEVQNIQAQRQAEIEGLQGQMNKDVRDALNTGERGIMDKSGWNYGGSYHADDAILHTQAQNLFETSQNQIQSVISQLHAGKITETQAIEMLTKAEANLSTTVNNALQPLYSASKAYAQGHSFAYDATLVPTEWFANHPNAFVDFGNALVAINQSADALTLLSPSIMQTIGALPSDLATTLAAGISSLALVKNVQTTMKNKTSGKIVNHKKDELGEMFGEHVVNRGEEEEKGRSK